MKAKVWLLICFSLFTTGAAAEDGRTLERGDDLIHGFAYFKGRLWASTRTSPCRILRIDPETMEYDRIILDSGMDDGEDLIAAEGYIWTILWTNPCMIARVDPETMEWSIALTLDGMFQGGSLEYAFGRLWAGGRYGRIAGIDLKDMSYQVYDYFGFVKISAENGLKVRYNKA